MADRQLQNILSSGEVTNTQIGGATIEEEVMTFADLTNTEIVARAKLGLMVMSGNSLTPQTIAVTPTKVALFDTKDVEAGVGVSGDVALSRATATRTGVFKLRFEAFISYASNVDITFQMYKNSVAFGNSITLSGQGAKVFPITLITSANLSASDYLELYATASAETDITISQANGTLEKTIF